jgi:hypothetical protein
MSNSTNMKKFCSKICLIILIVSCNSNKEEPPLTNATTESRIELDNLQPGQINSYLKYTADCFDPEDTFKYTGDTLTVQIDSTSEGLVPLTNTF